MVKKLSDDPEKRRYQVFKILYSYFHEWGSLIESGDIGYFLTTQDGEEVYRNDLLVGLPLLNEKQSVAFELICLKGMTETQAVQVAKERYGISTPIQQHADVALKIMVKAYDDRQLGVHTRKKRPQKEEQRMQPPRLTLVKDTSSVETVQGRTEVKTTRLGVRQRALLQEMSVHKVYSRGGDWRYNSHSETVEILESLVQRGLVLTSQDGDEKKYYVS